MSDLGNAIKQICDEKGLSYDVVVNTIESALAAAYRKDFGKKNQNIVVKFDPETAKSKVFDVKEIVEDMPEEPADAEVLADKKAIDDKKEAVETRHASFEDDKKKKDKAHPSTSSGQVKKTKDVDSKHASSQTDDKGKDKKNKNNGAIENENLSPEALAEEERKFNPKTEMQISDARLIKKTAKIGEELKMKLDIPDDYGRMAAQTAKQVIIQRLREAEREMIFNDFKEKEHEVVSGVVQRREGKIVLIDLGKAIGVLPPDEMINNEEYRSGDRIKVYVKEVNSRPKGPEIVLSRTSEEILKKVFYLEIPEISNGLIEIKGITREAGYRSKVAVLTDSDNVDPIGSCVGQRGVRIQTIIAELGGEKVDIIQYDDDAIRFITNALSPAKIIDIDLDEKENKAKVKVASDQLSLAIGKGGQNARLAAKLTGWKIDIVEDPSTFQSNSGQVSSPQSDSGQTGQVKEKDDVDKKQASSQDKEDEKKDPSTSSGQAKDKEDKKEKKDDDVETRQDSSKDDNKKKDKDNKKNKEEDKKSAPSQDDEKKDKKTDKKSKDKEDEKRKIKKEKKTAKKDKKKDKPEKESKEKGKRKKE